VSTANKRGLGRGFDVLIPVEMDVSGVTAGVHEKVHKLALDVVKPKDDQPRQGFDEEALQGLAQSIVQYGILQPIIVRQIENNLYSIIAGERRWRAARIAGLKEIPAIVRSVTDHEQLELALLENVQRTDLTPLELAAALYKLHTEFNQKYEDISERIGKAYSTVINNIRLLNLPADIKKSLQAGEITEGHARTLLSLQDYPAAQKALFKNILTRHWNVRQAEQYVVAVKKGQVDTKSKGQKTTVDVITNKIKKHLNAEKVYVQRSKKGSGKLVITYKTEAEFAKIVEHILGS
jgi:ParB family chromosome partitioning protein